MQIELPYPPSSNRYWRKFRNRMVVSDEANAYRQNVAALCLERRLQPVDGPVAVSLYIRRPAKRRDIDNHQKVLLDALQGFAYHNDAQIFRLLATMEDNKKAPGVTVVVEELN